MEAFDDVRIELVGGEIAQLLYRRDRARLTIDSGTARSVTGYDDSHIRLSAGGTLTGSNGLRDSARLLNDGATVSSLRVRDASRGRQTSGSIGTLTVDSRMAISGGAVSGETIVSGGGILSISGGEITADVNASANSEVHLRGLYFEQNGVDITPMLELYTPYVIEERTTPDVGRPDDADYVPPVLETLSGNLVDRSAFAFDMNPTNRPSDYAGSEGYFDPEALVTVTLVLPGDYSQDGVVDAADYTVWRDNSVVAMPDLVADGNFDGVVDEFDYEIWARWYGETAQSLRDETYDVPPAPQRVTPAPEPSAGLLGGLAFVAWGAFRRRLFWDSP